MLLRAARILSSPLSERGPRVGGRRVLEIFGRGRPEGSSIACAPRGSRTSRPSIGKHRGNCFFKDSLCTHPAGKYSLFLEMTLIFIFVTSRIIGAREAGHVRMGLRRARPRRNEGKDGCSFVSAAESPTDRFDASYATVRHRLVKSHARPVWEWTAADVVRTSSRSSIVPSSENSRRVRAPPFLIWLCPSKARRLLFSGPFPWLSS